MATKLDKSDSSVVAYCTVCGWREVATTTLPARRAAAEHERAAHPESRTAYHALDMATRRLLPRLA